MLGLELVVALGVATLVCAVAAPRLRVAVPVLLVAVGLLLGLVPAFREAHLPSEVVLLVFLPALLWWESLTTSLREIRRFLRVIVLSSTVLVVATAAAVAAIAHSFGMPWGPAWVLGAALAPTDATAVGALARSLPRRNLTILRAESLINDGTALVILGVAIAVTAGTEHVSAGHVSWLVVLSYGGGVLAGLLTYWLITRVRDRLNDPVQESLVSVLAPFAAYLLAETVEASGVIAVVTAGLLLSQAGPRRARADARQLTQSFWTLATYALNAALFLLVGVQAHAAVRDLDGQTLARGGLLVVVVTAVLIAVRLVWVLATPHLIRAVDRRPAQRALRAPAAVRLISGVAGFRGAISLAAALSVPATVASGQPFPERDLIVFVAAGVVLATLVVQAPLLPVVVRRAKLPIDDVDAERYLAQTSAAHEALSALPVLAADLRTDPGVIERLRQEIEEHLDSLRHQHQRAGDSALPQGQSGSHAQEPGEDQAGGSLHRGEQYTALRLALLERKRSAVLALRNSQHIDDVVLRQVQAGLDREELRLVSRHEVE